MKKRILILAVLFCFSGLFYSSLSILEGAGEEMTPEKFWQSLNAQIVQAYHKGKYAEAIPLAEKAREYATEHFGKEHPDTLTSINNLALLYQSQGRYGESEPLYKEALQLSEKVLGKEHPDTLTSINNLALLYGSQGRYGEAEPLFKEALQLSEKVLGKEHPDTLQSINNLAALYYSQGRYGEAEPMYKGALQLREKVLGKEHPSTLGSINNLAQLYRSQGRYGEAEPLYKEALQLREKVLGKEHPSTLSSINNLAALYYSQGRYGEAESLLKEALQLSEKVLGKEHPNTLTFINNLAELYRSQGRYGEAEPLYKEALQLSEKVLGKEHPDTLLSISNLATLYQSQGRYGEAEPLYKEALQLREKVLGKAHPDTLTSQSNYIVLLVNIDNPRMAFRLLKEMEGRLFSRSFQQLYTTSEGRVRRLFLRTISKFQDIAFSFAQKYPDPLHIRYAADVVLRWKQVYAEEYAFQHRLLCFSTDPDMQELRARMAGLRSELSEKIHHAGKGRGLWDIISDLNTAEEKLRQKAMSLKPVLQVSRENLDQITGKLPKQSALIEFRMFYPVDFKTGKTGAQSWAAYLFLSDIEAEKQLFFENLGSFEELDRILKNSKDTRTGLYTMFLSKFEKHLKGVKTLYIAPDGFLNIVSFASLKPSEDIYLVQKYQINRLQTGRDLGHTQPRSSSSTLVAFGGVDYGQLPGMSQNETISEEIQKLLEEINPNLKAARELEEGIKYLKHSLEESEIIARLFEINCKGGKAILYKDKEATEKRLKELEAPPRILHLSTHGFYLQKAEDSPLAETEPMVLSGLALTGANLGLKGFMDENGDDGLLYSLEVLGLNLQGTELVSLSACETGKGVVDYSEGVYGLVQAFLTAGARSVLMTLSSVGDQPSKDFMVKFYEIWLSAPEGTSPAEALHQARIHFITHSDPKYNDPGFWSPYVLVGGV